MEGRDLSSRQAQDTKRDMEIGQPIKSYMMFRSCRDGVAREDGSEVLSGEPDAGNLHVRFDERGVETELWLSHSRQHRQTKGAGTGLPSLTSPRHISTLPDLATSP